MKIYHRETDSDPAVFHPPYETRSVSIGFSRIAGVQMICKTWHEQWELQAAHPNWRLLSVTSSNKMHFNLQFILVVHTAFCSVG